MTTSAMESGSEVGGCPALDRFERLADRLGPRRHFGEEPRACSEAVADEDFLGIVKALGQRPDIDACVAVEPAGARTPRRRVPWLSGRLPRRTSD